MKPLTAEWVQKAEADFAGVAALRRARGKALHDLVCFHCQQCAEKYLKALLQEAGVRFPKTHVLTDLLGLTTPMNPKLSVLRPHLQVLEDYAVKFRYPGLYATAAQSRASLSAVRAVRRVLRKLLGL